MSSFSLNRLGKLITKQFFENSRLYSFSILALVGLLSLAFTFWISMAGPNYREEGTYIIFVFGLFLAGSIFASMSFNMLGSKDKAIYWLSVPATHLEKLICTILYSTILFTIVYCLCFFVVKNIAVAFLHEYMKQHPETVYRELKNFDEGFGSVLLYFIFGYFAVQALHLLGSVYFSRYSFILTTIVAALLLFSFGYYITKLEDYLLGEGIAWDLTSAHQKKSDLKDSYLLYEVSPAISNVLKYALQFALAPIFWVVTWFRLKEKEV